MSTPKFIVQSIDEYLALPALDIPPIPNAKAIGKKYEVHKVGFYLASENECRSRKVEAELVREIGKCPLPTIVVTAENKEKRLYRLPQSLASFAFDCVALAKSMGKSPFPNEVAFGIFEDRHYAELI